MERVLDVDLAGLEREDVEAAPLGPFNCPASCSTKGPFGYAAVPANEMVKVVPARIREVRQTSGDALPDFVKSFETLAADIGAEIRKENTILRHESHDAVEVMAIVRIRKCIEEPQGRRFFHGVVRAHRQVSSVAFDPAIDGTEPRRGRLQG